MLKAVLFDLDDTLIDWSAVDLDWETRDREMLGRVSTYISDKIQPISDFKRLVTDYRERTYSAWEDGRSSLRAPHMGRILVESLVASGIPAEHVDEIEALTAFDWGAIPGITLFPDVPDVLELLLAHDIRIGIVTNAHQPMWLRDRELEHFDLLKYFEDCRFSAADVGYLKPHPRIFEAALECIGSEPDETVFVGDSPVADVAGAQGAGLKAVLRVRKTVTPMLSGLIVPDHTVSSLADLPVILDEWYPGWRT